MNQADMTVEAAKVMPATPVPIMTFMGYGVADWASAVTLGYVLLLAAHFLWVKIGRPWWRARRPRRER
ncbi:hypothetical protein BKK81_23590 [Cupriavidus sp. USMAHM13]|uniref:hypothetical protein n=1 Tax=Cupriavidus sp. USMAHM13 TaxID=1389192 RepID=UPI0008A6B343|nr:hypothetical protein [Cupriavidus sp. USMAHM13]AOZ02269.1 hypothetical protein BKK81_23590 [Cupriavidus sp. USMAHM13]